MAPSLLRTAAAVSRRLRRSAAAAGTNANGQIVFSSFRDGRAGDLWSMSPDGRDLRELTGDPEPAVTVNDAQADWSPDGRAIAFRRGPGATVDLSVWRMAWDGSGKTRLTDSPGRDESPDWQPVPLGEEMTACGDADATGPGASSVHAIRLDCRRALDAAARWARAATAGDPPARVRGLACDAAPTGGAGRLVTCTRRGATGTTVRFVVRD